MKCGLRMLSVIVLLQSFQCLAMDNALYQVGKKQNSSSRLQASTPLHVMLGPRRTGNPLLTKDKRETNMALVKSIGSYDARKKLGYMLLGVCALNAIKELTLLGLWGYETLKPLNPLIPSSHMLPLQHCTPICYQSGCCGADCLDGMDCGPIVCTNQTTCNANAPSVPTGLWMPSALINAVNLSALPLALILIGCSSSRQSVAEQELADLIANLPEAPTSQELPRDIETGESEGEQQPLVQGNYALTEKQQKNIDLIRSLGYHSTALKMWGIIGCIFGLNAAKDTITEQLFGFTNYVTTNATNATMTTPHMNNIGKTVLGTALVNASGLALSCLLIGHSGYKQSQESKELETLLTKIDKLIKEK